MPWCGKIPHAQEQLSPSTAITEPTFLEPGLHSKRSRHDEKPVHHNEEQPRALQLEKAHAQQQSPSAVKNKK